MLLLTAQNELLVFFIKNMDQSKPIYIASIPNRCTQHQPKNNLHSINPITVHTASDFLLVGFPGPKTYTLPSTPHHPVILREAEGEVAESIIQKLTLALLERGDLLPREKVFLCFLKMWILQLRASPACRMTWEWGDRREEENSSLSVQLQTTPKTQTA